MAVLQRMYKKRARDHREATMQVNALQNYYNSLQMKASTSKDAYQKAFVAKSNLERFTQRKNKLEQMKNKAEGMIEDKQGMLDVCSELYEAL